MPCMPDPARAFSQLFQGIPGSGVSHHRSTAVLHSEGPARPQVSTGCAHTPVEDPDQFLAGRPGCRTRCPQGRPGRRIPESVGCPTSARVAPQLEEARDLGIRGRRRRARRGRARGAAFLTAPSLLRGPLKNLCPGADWTNGVARHSIVACPPAARPGVVRSKGPPPSQVLPQPVENARPGAGVGADRRDRFHLDELVPVAEDGTASSVLGARGRRSRRRTTSQTATRSARSVVATYTVVLATSCSRAPRRRAPRPGSPSPGRPARGSRPTGPTRRRRRAGRRRR